MVECGPVDTRWNLLRIEPCRACGRPAAEGCACGWCGERAPVSPHSLGHVLLFGLGLILVAVGDRAGPEADSLAAAHLAPLLSVLSALAGFWVAAPLRGTPDGRRALPAAALAAGAAALAAKLAPPEWTGTAADAAWAVPAAIAAGLLLLPAPLPPVPAPTAIGRLGQRFNMPLLFAAALFATFAWAFAEQGPHSFFLLGFAVSAGALGLRLRRPAPLLVAVACWLPLVAADPAAAALGVVASGFARSLTGRSPR